ncbi:MAG TPA: class I SAM-dependent methyltransferase, partial [Steroidobacteraceae bacterium]
MNDTTLIELSRAAPRPNPLGMLARRAVLARLAGLSGGLLRIREDAGTLAFGEGAGPEATLTVHDPAFYAETAWGGSVGAAESYMLGHWHADDLTALMRLMLRNHEVLDGMERGLARLSAPLRRLAHWLHRNTRAGSRRNIAAHYDLGNDFFRLMLDETMMYSCALFERPEMTLAEASTAKLDRVCRALALGPADHVLEIGTGWGGFALHAASRYGCRVT